MYKQNTINPRFTIKLYGSLKNHAIIVNKNEYAECKIKSKPIIQPSSVVRYPRNHNGYKKNKIV